MSVIIKVLVFFVVNIFSGKQEMCVSELGILIKQNGITWAQVEEYLMSKNISPSAISSIQTVFEKESGQSGHVSSIDSETDTTNIMANNSIYNIGLDNPDNIFQEATQEQNKEMGISSSKSEEVLMGAIVHITGGIMDYGTGDDIPVHEKPKLQYEPTYNNISYNKPQISDNETNSNDIKPDETIDNNTPNNEIEQEQNFSKESIETTNDEQQNISNEEISTTSSEVTPQIHPEQIEIPNYNYNEINPFINSNIQQNYFNDFNITPFSFNQNFGYNDFLINNPNLIKFNFNTDINFDTFNNHEFNQTEIGVIKNPITIDNNKKVSNKNKKTNESEDVVEAEKPKYKGDLKKRIESLEANGDEFEITEKPDGTVSIHVTDGNYLRNAKIKEIYLIYSKDGNLKQHQQLNNNGQSVHISYEKGKKQIFRFDNAIPDKIMDMAKEIQAENGTNIDIQSQNTSDTYKIKETNLTNKNIKMIETTCFKEPWQIKANKDFKGTTKKEDFYLRQKITYTDGTEEIVVYEKGKIKQKNTKKAEKTQVLPKNTKLRTAAKISFEMPKDAPKKAQTYANALCKNKQQLMNELKIDNDTYNILAKTAIGIAGRESDMGEDIDLIKKDAQRYAYNNSSLVRRFVGKHHFSRGIAQVKYGLYIQEPDIKEQFEKFGIKSENDLEDPEKCAIAVIIVLNKKNKQLNSEKWQNALEKCNDGHLATRNGYELDKNGLPIKTGHTVPWKNVVTREDALMALYHGNDEPAAILNGTFEPMTRNYMASAKKYMQQYVLKEDSKSRKVAEQKEIELLKHDEEYAPYKDMTNSGPMGDIVFMPAIYKNKEKIVNTKDEIAKLEKVLKDKKINNKLSEKLIKALKNQEIAFNFGLTENEMKSLTESDIELLLNHLENLKNRLGSINTSDGINNKEVEQLRSKSKVISNAENNFRKEYLTRHSAVYNATEENKRILREFSTYSDEENYAVDGIRRGFAHEKAKGVNVNTTKGRISKQNEVLANSAYNVVKKNPKNQSGMCLEGVKTAMRDAGMDVSDMAKFGSSPKAVKNWFDSKVSQGILTQVEYVSVGKDKARVINETDLKTLPAGYFVIFVPGSDEKFSEEKGHAFITNGFGQGYADATDNLEWRRYSGTKTGSGKGEHGKFYVYKLSDRWTVDESTQKLKLRS